MPLSGTININGNQIGSWTAVRRYDPTRAGDQVYDCTASLYGDRSPRGHVSFTVDHNPWDGAIALSLAVLGAAQRLLVPEPRPAAPDPLEGPLRLCGNCGDGNHYHDRYPDGLMAECPYLTGEQGDRGRRRCGCRIHLPIDER